MEQLKLLERRVDKIVTDQEKGVGIVAEPTPDARMYGFNIPGKLMHPKTEQALIESRKAQVSGYRDKAAKLRVSMLDEGIQPIAVLPFKAWRQIVAEHGLFTFRAPEHNTISVQAYALMEKLRPSWGVAHGISILLSLAIAAAVFYAMVRVFAYLDWWTMDNPLGAFCFAACAVLAFCTFGAGTAVRFSFEERIFQRQVTTYLRDHTWSQVLHDLCGDEKWNYFSGHSGSPVRIALPQPPDDVAQTILKVSRGRFVNFTYITAEADAITFVEPVSSLLKSQYDFKVASERSGDPIIWIKGGENNVMRDDDPVAIVGQYGNFKFEEAALERALTGGRVV